MKKAGNWQLVGKIALVLIAMVAGILFYQGFTEAGLRMVIRATARTSLFLFLLAFSASSLRRLWRHAATAWLLRNRRYLGVSFAVSHFLHLGAIVALAQRFPHPFMEQSAQPLVLIGGGLGYLLIAAMVATSFDRSAAWLGARRWRILHTVGNYWVLAIFANSYLGRALREPAYLPAMLGIVLALGLRVIVYLRRKQ
jgi:sulfoxide reductase heme-binding subunit YedZ